MDALRDSKGPEFDHLFLVGMIQHHNGALTMVKDLFNTAGAGQDAALFNFATDADNTQRAEIRIMQSMLDKESPRRNDDPSAACRFSSRGRRRGRDFVVLQCNRSAGADGCAGKFRAASSAPVRPLPQRMRNRRTRTATPSHRRPLRRCRRE